MRDVVLLGGGGHATSCLDAFDMGAVRVVGYVAKEPDDSLGLPYLGDDDVLPDLRHTVPEAFVAVGSNKRRAALTATLTDLGYRLATIVAETARISPTATIGPGSIVLHGALVGPRTRVGAGVVINTAASVDHDCVVGDFSHIGPGSHLAGAVGVGTGSFAGVGVAVIPDVQIGDWAVVGAGSVVIDQVPAGTTVVGAPARTRRRS